MDDSFSPRGEAFVRHPTVLFYHSKRKLPPKASPLREKLSENRLFGTDFLTDVGDRRDAAAGDQGGDPTVYFANWPV